MADERELQGMQTEQASDVVNDPLEYSFAELGFTGNYTHGLDAKGRLIIPAPFREGLGQRFAVCLSEDFQSIAIYPLADWVKRRNMYVALCAKNATIRPILNQFTKFSYVDSEMDAQGRLLLPSALRNHFLKDSREVDVSGAYDCIIVTDSEKSRLDTEAFYSHFPDVPATLAEAQKG